MLKIFINSIVQIRGFKIAFVAILLGVGWLSLPAKALAQTAPKTYHISKHSPLGPDAREEKEKLSRFDLYQKVKLLLPTGWNYQQLGDEINITYRNATVINDAEDLEDNASPLAISKLPKETYTIRLRFKPYSTEDYAKNAVLSQEAFLQLQSLKERYGINKMMQDPTNGLILVDDTDERNRFAKYKLKEQQLRQQLNLLPEYYVKDYAVEIDYNSLYYRIFPDKLDREIKDIVRKIQLAIVAGK